MPMVPCQHCTKIFSAKAVRIAQGYGKYCSQSCYFAEKAARKAEMQRQAMAALGSEVPLYRCTKCGGYKTFEEMGKTRAKKSGLHPWCKSCMCIKTALLWLLHPEKMRESNRKWRAGHPDAVKAWKRIYWQRHAERLRPLIALRRKARRHTARITERRWRQAHPENIRVQRALRRARKKHAPMSEKVSLDVLYQRDRGLCGLCHKKVARQDATTDHIIPLSKGGPHTYPNCVLAHRSCNSKKNNKAVPQQMRLLP